MIVKFGSCVAKPAKSIISWRAWNEYDVKVATSEPVTQVLASLF